MSVLVIHADIGTHMRVCVYIYRYVHIHTYVYV